MICVSITPESRRLAKADLLNACRRGDVVEVCLDHLVKSPDVADILSAATKPVIVSCRREQDGGHWKGTEAERLQLLRAAIVAGPAYVELELETAKAIPRFGKTQRIVCHTNRERPLGNVDALYEQAVAAGADVVKFVAATPNLEAAWSLLASVSKKREKPVVGQGIGRSAGMLSILGLRFGAPWVHAALEPGMESHEGELTRDELDDVYDAKNVGPKSRFLGVAGFGPEERSTIGLLNAGLRKYGGGVRCLPLHPTRMDKFAKMLDVLNVVALMGNPEIGTGLHSLADEFDDVAFECGCADVLVRKDGGWKAGNLLGRSVARALVDLIAKDDESGEAREAGLAHRKAIVVGGGGLASSVAAGLLRKKANVAVAAVDHAAAQAIATKLGVRGIPLAEMYTTLADIIVLADPAMSVGHGGKQIAVGFLRPSMIVADVTRLPEETQFLREARDRRCRTLDPQAVHRTLIARQFQTLTGKPLPDEVLAASATPPT